jgi:ATP-binding cassette, subfamily B, bacterial
MTDTLDQQPASSRQQKARIGQIMAYLWGHWSSQPAYLIIVVILMILSSICELALPYLSGLSVSYLVDQRLPTKPLPFLVSLRL